MLAEQEGMCEVTMPDDDQHCLRLLRVGRGAAGPLVCEVSNRHGAARCTLRLRLAGRCPHTGRPCPSVGGEGRAASPYGAPSPCAMGALPHSMALLLSAPYLYVMRMLLYRVAMPHGPENT